MILSARQSRSFYRVFNAFCHFAAERLGIAPLRTLPGGAIDEYDIARVCEAVWGDAGDRTIADEFLGARIVGINRTEQRLAAGWGEAIQGYFLVVPDGGDTYFTYARHAFAVRGLTREVTAGLPRPPLSVQATLLPFDGVVTYAINLVVHEIEMGPGMQRMARETLETALSEGKVVRTERQFLKLAPVVRELAIDEEASFIAEQTEQDMNADELAPGQHVGVLAALPWDERIEAIAAHDREVYASRKGRAARSTLDALCHRGAPATKLDEYVARLDPDELETLLAALDIADAGEKHDSEALSEEIRDAVAEDGYGLMSQAIMRGRRPVEDVRKVVREGGRLAFSRASFTTIEDAIQPVPPVLALYRVGEAYVASIPDEFQAVLERLDFDELLERAGEFDDIVRYLEILCDARGIVEVGEALAICVSDLKITESANDVLWAIRMRLAEDTACFDIAELDGATYLISLDLAVSDEDGRLDEDDEAMARWLLSRHEEIEPRPLLDVFRHYPDVRTWMFDRESARALARFFDERVPDGEDDYHFADDAMLELPDYVQQQDVHQSLIAYFEMLADMGFVPTLAQANATLGLCTNFANDLPKWANNGWTPGEVFERYGR